LYGKENLSYNVHGLLHVTADVKNFGNINSYSAFEFENYLGSLVRLVRNGNLPLVQVSRRLSERESADNEIQLHVGPKQQQQSGPLLQGLISPQFVKYQFAKFQIGVGKRDSYFQTKSGKLVKVLNFATSEQDKQLKIVGKSCLDLVDFYSSPCPSSNLGIYSFSELGPSATFDLNCVKRKYFVFPSGSTHFVAFPLLHCN